MVWKMWDKDLKEDNGLCLKQSDTFSCMICVASMATGTKRQEVIDFIGMDGSEHDSDSKHPDKCRGISAWDIYSYLINNNVYPGFLDATFLNPVKNMDELESIQLEVPIKDYPAIVSVKSRRLPEGNIHAVYWTGKEILDPDPGFSGTLADYDIVGWLPLVRAELFQND